MQFNFDNLNNEESVPEAPQTPEITQEEFDAQIEREAAKLKTSVEELAKEINQHGGPEEFKRRMETNNYYFDRDLYQRKRAVIHQEGVVVDSRPEGKAIIDTHEESSNRHMNLSKNLDKVGLALSGAAVLLEVWADKLSDEIGMTGLGELMDKMNLGEDTGADYTMPALIGMFAVGAVGTMYTSLVEKIKANKIKREAARQELKHKMTGVEFK